MLATTQPLIWPLMDKLRPPIAYQRRPKSAGNLGVTLPPVIPWDNVRRPGMVGFGQVESDPQLWNVAPWNFGLAAISVQSAFLTTFKTNPRAHPLSEQRRVPAPIRPPSLWQFLPSSPPPPNDKQTNPIIWTLLKSLAFNPRRIVAGSPVNLQAMVRNAVAVQQNPKAGLRPVPPTLPFPKTTNKPAVVHALKLPARTASISGVTRDSTGVILGSCVVELYLTATDEALFKTISDASTGAFSFANVARFSPATHYLVAYKAGSPDVAGTSLNTLTGVG